MPVPALPHLRRTGTSTGTVRQRRGGYRRRCYRDLTPSRLLDGRGCGARGSVVSPARRPGPVGWGGPRCVCVCVWGEQRENGATPTGEPLTWNRARGGVVVGEPDNRARRSRSRPVRSAIRTLVARTLEPWDPALSGPGASSWVGGGGGARCLLSAENRSPPERGVLVTRGDTRTRFPVPAVAAPSVLWDSLVYN